MRMPFYTGTSSQREMQSVFGGYNNTENCSEYEFYDSNNLSSDLFPILSVRKKRNTLYATHGAPDAIIAKEKLCYISKNTFFIDGEPVEDFEIPTVGSEENPVPIQLVSMGANVIIWPQALYINVITGERGSMEEFKYKGAVPTFYISDERGTDLFGYANGNYPTSKKEGEEYGYYIDTSRNFLFQRTGEDSWAHVESYITFLNWYPYNGGFTELDVGQEFVFKNFFEEVSGANGKKHKIVSLNHEESADTFFTIKGILPPLSDIVIDQEKEASISEELPILDYIIECGNRLWGCRYGENNQSQFVNEIRATALGSFSKWNLFDHSAEESFVQNLGSDGVFTGAIKYGDTPIFFKEKILHKVYGTLPENYQLQTASVFGVQEGSWRSIAVVSNVLFYKGVDGIYGYDGTEPVKVSDALGLTGYRSAVGGACDQKYYVTMRDKNGVGETFAYDTERRVWHKESNIGASGYSSSANRLYYANEHGVGYISTMETEVDDSVSWYGISGVYGKGMSNHKNVYKIQVRADLKIGSIANIFIEYDSSGNWEHLCVMEGRKMESYSVPLRIARCDHFRLKIAGKGDIKVHSITKYTKEGRR